MLRRRAAAAFMSTKPSGRMEARSLRRTVPVIRFHMRIRRRSMCLVVERRLWGLVEVERKGKGLSLGFWGGGETRLVLRMGLTEERAVRHGGWH